MINGKKMSPLNDEPVTTQSAQQSALEAIENRHGANVRRDRIPGDFKIIESFRRPNGVWWLKALCIDTNRVRQIFATPVPQFTPLKTGTILSLTKVTCEDCTYYEVT